MDVFLPGYKNILSSSLELLANPPTLYRPAHLPNSHPPKQDCKTFSFQTMKLFQLARNIDINPSNPIFLPTAYSPALIYFGRERGWWITCNYPTVLKEKNIEKQKEYNLRYLLAKVRTT